MRGNLKSYEACSVQLVLKPYLLHNAQENFAFEKSISGCCSINLRQKKENELMISTLIAINAFCTHGRAHYFGPTIRAKVDLCPNPPIFWVTSCFATMQIEVAALQKSRGFC